MDSLIFSSRVIRLDFNMLEGQIPCELEALLKLSELNLSKLIVCTNLELIRMTKYRVNLTSSSPFYLDFNELSGSIPKGLNADVIHIGKLIFVFDEYARYHTHLETHVDGFFAPSFSFFDANISKSKKNPFGIYISRLSNQLSHQS